MPSTFGVVGILLISCLALSSDTEERTCEAKYKGALRGLWVRAQVNWETSLERLGEFSREIASRLVAAFHAFGSILSLQFTAASMLLGSIALTICSILATLEGGPNIVNSMLTIAKVSAESFVLLFYVRTLKTRFLITFVTLCTFEIATPEYGPMAINGVDLFLLKLSFHAPAYLLSCIYVPFVRTVLGFASSSRWAPVIVPTIASVPFAAIWAIFTWLIDDLERSSSPYSLSEIYGSLSIAVCLFCLAVAGIVNAVVLWRALIAVAWNLASRVFHSLHDKGPTKRSLYWLGWLLIGLSIAGDPVAWVVKSMGLPETSGFVEPKPK